MKAVLAKNDNVELFWKYVEEVNSRSRLPRYDRTNIDWVVDVSVERGLLHADKSFVYLINNSPIAAVFLPIEGKEQKAITFNGSYVYAPLITDEAHAKEIFELIDAIAKENQVSKIMFEIDPLEKTKYNYLQKFRYLDASILSYTVSLKEADHFVENCRRGHRCDIKQMLKNSQITCFVLDSTNADYKHHEEYRNLHLKCSGKETRSKSNFDKQFEMLKNGQAILVGLRQDKINIAYSYFQLNGDKAIYSSGADDPEFAHMPLYHLMIYAAVEYLAKIGVKTLDMGQPSSPSIQFGYVPDQKQLNIALFKRGFPGEYTECFRGIKYFSEDTFRNEMGSFINNYSEYLSNI